MRLSVPLLFVALGGCVPNGPASSDAGAAGAAATATPKPRTDAGATRTAPKGSAGPATLALASPPLGAGFSDDFERATVGDDWRSTSEVWRIQSGRLCGKGARNHGVWLDRQLPVNVRVEFDAVSDSPDGDIKAEIFGDGQSAATGASYVDATSYLTIFGGWKNTFHVLARINEHASDRPEIRVDPKSDDDRARPVAAGQSYHFKIERADGRTLKWFVDDRLMFSFEDKAPLAGPGHDHLGFNDWDVPVCFDNVRVTPL
jgi:hypothetical protein